MLGANTDAACSNERFIPEAQTGAAAFLVFLILSGGLFGLGGQNGPGRTVQFFARFVKANDRIIGVIRPLVNVQHVFPFAHVLRRGLADTPRLDAPGLDFVFFSVVPTVT